MKKLEIELFRYGSALFGKVLYMDENLRGKGELITDGTYSIKSYIAPNIGYNNVLYVNGKNESCDGKFMFIDFKSEDEAIKASEKYRELIDKLNSEEDTQTGSSQIVKVI